MLLYVVREVAGPALLLFTPWQKYATYQVNFVNLVSFLRSPAANTTVLTIDCLNRRIRHKQ